MKTFKKLMYGALYKMTTNELGTPEMRQGVDLAQPAPSSDHHANKMDILYCPL
jgi:hypothetical protein